MHTLLVDLEREILNLNIQYYHCLKEKIFIFNAFCVSPTSFTADVQVPFDHILCDVLDEYVDVL